MKIECLAGGNVATMELHTLRTGRFQIIFEQFDAESGAAPMGCAIMESDHLLQLAREALVLIGRKDLVEQIQSPRPWWGVRKGRGKKK